MPAKISCANSASQASARAEDRAWQCPLCSQPNRCDLQGRANDRSADLACWCMQRPALGVDWLAQHLPRLSAAQRSCLCPACHEQLENEKSYAAIAKDG